MPTKTFFRLPEERRKAIIEQAVAYYIRTPFDRVTLRDLAKTLGMPIGTFYRYFTDKNELFLYLCDLLSDEYQRTPGFIEHPPFASPREDANPPRVTKFLDALQYAPEDVQRRFDFDTYADKGMAIYRKELEQLDARGALRDDAEIDLIAFIYATIGYNLNMYFARMGVESEEERWRLKQYLFYSFFKYGLMGQPEGPEKSK